MGRVLKVAYTNPMVNTIRAHRLDIIHKVIYTSTNRESERVIESHLKDFSYREFFDCNSIGLSTVRFIRLYGSDSLNKKLDDYLNLKREEEIITIN